VGLAGATFELQQRGGTSHVGRHQQDALLLAGLEPERELGGGGGLASALQAREQHDRRRLHAQVERAHALAHHLDEFVVDDLDECLARREALVDFLADHPRPDTVDERLDDGQRHVRLEQRHAHLPQRVPDVFLGQAATPAQSVDDGGQAR
jgi:hypothetical protein